MDINNVLISGDVERFHQCTGMTKQRNSEHQWGVALLVQHFDKQCRKEVILAALTHDATELVLGDIPAPTKWTIPEIKVLLDKAEENIEVEWGIHFKLSPVEKHLLKLCDMFEGMQYCIKRVKMGERRAAIPFKAWANHIDNKFVPLTLDRYSVLSNVQREFYNNLLNEMHQLEMNNGS